MRRKDRQITNTEAYSILENGEYGILSTVSSNNEAYGVPLNYCLIDKCIYFHCALEGSKINNIDWIEEPIVCDNLDGYAKLTAELKTPIQIGENF